MPAILLLLLGALPPLNAAARPVRQVAHQVEPGDTWVALRWRYGASVDGLRAELAHPNPYRQPVIGDVFMLQAEGQRNGELVRPAGGLLSLAVRHNTNPWALASLNGVVDPYRPAFARAIFVPGGERPPRDLPAGFASLELSQIPAMPGRAFAYRAQRNNPVSVTARLDSLLIDSFANGPHLVGVGGTGAFFRPGAPELLIAVNGAPAWTQPWRFVDDTWDYDQVTLTGEAAAIDQEAIAAERARLFQIWSVVSPAPQWSGPFATPIVDFVQVSSNYGARRSYNGGPYSSYHEGVDFSAYQGTPVYASAAGTVVLAERLYVRGGAVIVDHGLGIYSGYYHLSAVHASPGARVEAGDLVGEVGTTGLSSGNHLHWDLLVAETWVDAAAWKEQGMACWILAGWGESCP